MSENYKNTLADKYMRETNYILIKDTDDMDDLDAQWNRFCSYMTVRQQRLSDDKSIELWNMTNQQHYEQIKERLLSKLKEKDIVGDKHIHPTNKKDDPEFESIEDNDELESGRYLTFEELEKDYNEVYNESIVNTKDDNIDELQDDPNNNADLYNQNSNIKIIGSIKGNTPEEKLKNLEDEFIKYNSQSHDIRKKADDESRSLYNGMSNLDRYNKEKSELLSQISDETIQSNPFLSECYDEYKLNSINEAVKHKKMKRLEDLPYFTPQELIDLGVHGNNNYYSRMADNDGLTKDVSVSTWFDSYKDISMNHVFEDYRKEWINKLNELYSDYYNLTDEDEILARKQSILDLGWNPEIPFTPENRLKATDRVNKIFQDTVPEDIFIDMSNVPELDDESYNEMANPSDQEPVFLILTKGKTPVISHGIKFVTKSEYSHASIAFDPELKEAYSFNMRKQNWGFIRETLESFKDNVISVFTFFAPKNIVTKLKKTVYDFANHETNFDLRIFANKIFHINHKVSNNEYNQVCSTFVDTVLKSGGINLVGNQQIPSPADIYNGAKSQPNKIFEVYYGIAPKYNGKKVKNQINYLMHSEDTLSINEAWIKSVINESIAGISAKSNKGFDNNLAKDMKTVINSLNKSDFKGFDYKAKEAKMYYQTVYYDSNKPIGFAFTRSFDEDGKKSLMVSIALDPDYRGRGIALDMAKNVLNNAKQDKDIYQIYWSADASNKGSISLAKKAGFLHDYDYEDSVVYKKVNNKDARNINESVSYLNEAKKFPVEFDDDGNLTIYKCRMGNISYGDEIDDSVQLLESYRNTSNAEGIKYELARLWFIISDIEKKMTKRIDSKTYNGYVRNRATAMNVFKTNLEYLMKIDNTFNFAEYYNTTPFSDNSIKITNNTLKYSFKALKKFIMK